ncbi:MAG TPA: DUF4097 family beta strand repeat-containing protein [Acidimicrobiia bacterium]
MIHETFSVEGTPDLEVRFESGRVEVRDGPVGKVDVKVDARSPGFIVEQRGNAILVSSDKSSSWLSRGSAYVVIETPSGSDLSVSVASASVEADLPLGKTEIKTASGDIDINSAETLVVKTASGDLDVRSVDRALRFSSASGDLRVEKASGSVVATTASGDVHIEDTDAILEMSTASGDAYITRFEGRSASFKAMSGDVDLGIPLGSNVDLDVTLLSGKLRLPDSEPRGRPPERQMSIRAKLVSGDFTIYQE